MFTHRTTRTLAAAALIPVATAMAIESASLQPPAPPSASVSTPASQSVADAAHASPFTLNLGEQRFDPLDMVPSVPGWDDVRGDVPDLHLVQFAGPTQQRWLDDISATGFEIVQYIHPYSYIVWGKGPDAETLHDVVGVRWVGGFKPAYRVQPRWRDLPNLVVDVKVLIYRGADTDAVVRAIAALGGRSTGRKTIDSVLEVAKFLLPGNAIRETAHIPGVYSVQLQPLDGGDRGELSNQINNVASGVVVPGYQAWLTSIGVSGSGVVIANVDGGVQETHPDLVGRFLPCTGVSCQGTSSSHGTHTAGIMAGDGSSGTLDSNGFLRGLGVAPGANLVEQDYCEGGGFCYTDPGGMLQLMQDSVASGAHLSGNSWGPAGSPQGYDDDTRQVDVGARDADPVTPGNQPLPYILSFMNGNGGFQSQGTPDEAKNIFTIGSTKAQNGDLSQITAINDLSANSAHGPALDGRTIPHLVAPGCSVDSTLPTNSYGTNCGTSMASPHVSGAVALFIERMRGLGPAPDPSPALIKAAFLPVAFDLAGNLDADGNVLGHRFDSKQGWGRMNLPAVLDPPPNSVQYFDQEVLFDNTGEEWSTTFQPIDPAKPMQIMLVWTDAPGHGLGGSTPAWNNDLDLIVQDGADTYYGNDFDSNGWSQTGGAADGMNNTEGVILGPLPPSGVTVRVVASNINSDGVPNVGDGTDQDFALVAYNAATEPGFTLHATPSSQSACFPGSVEYAIDVASILGYSNSVTLSASGHPASTSATFSTNPVTPGGSSTLTISGAGVPGSFDINVQGVAIDQTRNIMIDLDTFDAVPALPAPTVPVNGAADVVLLPTLSWTGAAGAESYDVQLASDAGFTSIVESASTSDTTHGVTIPLSENTTYFWRVRGTNPCGDGTWSAAFSFITRTLPAILLVDDDDNSPDVRSAYTDTLDGLGESYDIWDTNNSDNEPDASELTGYETVIWFTGDEFGGACGPGAAGEGALATWLDNGGCLIMVSQDYYYDRGLTSFMAGYLGVESATSDVSQTTVTGATAPFAGLGPFTLVYPFTNYSDVLTPDSSAQLAFTGDAGNAAVHKDGGGYHTVFFGFPLEALEGEPTTDRETVLAAALSLCAGPACPADLNGDGVVNVLDLLDMLAAWGPNPGHVADLNADGTVNVLDLLEMLTAWGPCP